MNRRTLIAAVGRATVTISLSWPFAASAQQSPVHHHARPGKTKALIMCGTGYNLGKEFTGHRIK
jgi:hypothetical protein